VLLTYDFGSRRSGGGAIAGEILITGKLPIARWHAGGHGLTRTTAGS
jgi:hypothetical protein